MADTLIDSPKREALDALVRSEGWRLFTDEVARMWGASEGNGERFLQAVQAASKAEDKDALAHLRQIIVAQREIHGLLSWPALQLKQLQPAQTSVTQFSRRGSL